MPWTYEQRMERVIAKLADNERLPADNVALFKRAKFFGKYAFRITVHTDLSQIGEFDAHAYELTQALEPLGAHLSVFRRSYHVDVYGNDPGILVWLYKRPKYLLGRLSHTDPSHWHKDVPKTKKKQAEFYGEYQYRVRMKTPHWGTESENVEKLSELDIEHKLVIKPFSGVRRMMKRGMHFSPRAQAFATFVYVKRLNDALILKLKFGDEISSIDERD